MCKTDIALIHNNAKVGSQIASALSERKQRKTRLQRRNDKKEKGHDPNVVSTTVYLHYISVVP